MTWTIVINGELNETRKLKNLPVCVDCSHCKTLTKPVGSCFDVDCLKNPNLGGVTGNYKKCPSFERCRNVRMSVQEMRME